MERRASPSTPDDFELIERIAEGDARAYRTLVERHLKGVHAFATRLLGDRAEAEDVCQETFARVWKGASTFSPRAKPSTWLYRIARNLAVDRLRRRRETSEVDPDAAAASGRPSEHLERKRLAEAVQRALAELPERQRSAVTLSHHHGMSHEEIAGVLDVGVRAVESLLARGRRKLRELLSERYADEGS